MSGRMLIGVDWGTTSLRAALIAPDGAVIDRIEAGRGLVAIRDRAFEAVLEKAVAPWEAEGTPLPIVASGMVTSRSGWIETPYLPCPAHPDALARAAVEHVTPAGRRILFAPGMSFRHADGSPDVMRGEETQIAGLGPIGDALVVLPGTHSKWARMTNGRIVGFRSAMTGDVFAAVKDHTVLRLTTADAKASAEAFADGVRAGAADGGGGLLGKLFHLRAGGVIGDFDPAETAERLSGLLVGAEIAEARAFAPDWTGPVLIVGAHDLSARYANALKALGLASAIASTDAAFRGHLRMARAAGLIA